MIPRSPICLKRWSIVDAVCSAFGVRSPCPMLPSAAMRLAAITVCAPEDDGPTWVANDESWPCSVATRPWYCAGIGGDGAAVEAEPVEAVVVLVVDMDDDEQLAHSNAIRAPPTSTAFRPIALSHLHPDREPGRSEHDDERVRGRPPPSLRLDQQREELGLLARQSAWSPYRAPPREAQWGSARSS